MEPRRLLATFTVNTTTDDPGVAPTPGTTTLRDAINLANAIPGPSTINFAIPAALPSDASRSVAVPGFDPTTQTWRITPASPLPAITAQVTIDGYTQGQLPIAFRYPSQLATQQLSIAGSPTGGTFTLTTSAPLPVGTTAPIPFNASPSQVQAALTAIVGTASDGVRVFGGPFLPGDSLTIAFTGIDYANETIPPLTVNSSMLVGAMVPVATVTEVPSTDPDEIVSTPNTIAALDGNSAVPRLIIDGSQAGGAGFTLDSSDSILRGLIVDGFGVGVSVPKPGDVGNLIQGDDIGKYPLFPVFPTTGSPVQVNGTNLELIGGLGNSLQGVLLGSTNATVGGVENQDSDVIVGNGRQGVSILVGAQGNHVFGDQIGILGPIAAGGDFFRLPNGSDGVLIADSSNVVGGAAAGAGNLISANRGDGVHLVGLAATRNDILGNDIGVGPSGGFLFGSIDPGNLGDGVAIDNASDNAVGGIAPADRNVISANTGAGIRITGASGVRNSVQGNYIGLTAGGISALGNGQQGVAIFSADNVVGPANVISANLQGVLLGGAAAFGNLVQANLIGTNATGTAPLGNAQDGVLIVEASDNSVLGNAKGSQVISGNNIGVLIIGSPTVGSAASGNLVLGNFVGTDVSGTLDLGNAQSGVEVVDAALNAIGSPTATGRDLISANYVGVLITGPQATGNVVQGSLIGTDVTGQAALGNELDGVEIVQGATANTIGGPAVANGNTIAFNRRDGVRVEGPGVDNAILTNSIFANIGLGIDLVTPVPPATAAPNGLPNPPVLTAVATSIGATIITGTLAGIPNTAYTIMLFVNSPFDPTGVGEGGAFLGEVVAMTAADGVASFSANVPAVLRAGQVVTATATDPAGNTSEFSSPIGEVFGTVQFQMSDYVVAEGVAKATIVATRSGGSGGLFTVGYATGVGTAPAGTAYLPTSGTLTFEPGQAALSFTVTVLDNGLPEGDVTVPISLVNPGGPIALGPQSTTVLTILGNQPGTFQFSMAEYNVGEAAGTATINVTRTQAGMASTVNYLASGGSAVAGVDYQPVAGTLTFGPGVLTQSFTVPILINPLIKGNETVLLGLSGATGGTSLGSPSLADLIIVDDGVDRMGPHVTSVKAVAGPYGVAEIAVTYDEPVDPARAVNLLNYGYSVRTAGRDGKLGTKDDRLVGLCPATYNPATLTVTLPLAVAVPNGTKLLFAINATTDVPGVGVGVSDLLGNLLDGNNDGHPGGDYAATVVAQPAPSTVSAKSARSKAKPAGHPVAVTTAKAHPHRHPAPKPKAPSSKR